MIHYIPPHLSCKHAQKPFRWNAADDVVSCELFVVVEVIIAATMTCVVDVAAGDNLWWKLWMIESNQCHSGPYLVPNLTLMDLTLIVRQQTCSPSSGLLQFFRTCEMIHHRTEKYSNLICCFFIRKFCNVYNGVFHSYYVLILTVAAHIVKLDAFIMVPELLTGFLKAFQNEKKRHILGSMKTKEESDNFPVTNIRNCVS